MFGPTGPTSTSTLPPATTTTNPQHFSDVTDTIVDQQWLNAVDMELRNIATSTGATLNATDNTQCITAINSKISSAVATETSARQSAITAEASARATAVSNEATTRASADSTLQTNINNEATNRSNEDTNLQNQLNGKANLNGNAGQNFSVAGLAASSAGITGNLNVNGSGNFGSTVACAAASSGGDAVILNQFGGSFGGTGYQKLPSGLIIQWGSYTFGSNSDNVGISFPIAFPNAYLAGFACEANAVGTWGVLHPTSYGVSAQTNSHMQVWGLIWNGSNWVGTGNISFNWWAVGI